jgi:hypothetical protein
MLTVKADLQVAVSLEPGSLDFGTVSRGRETTRAVKLVGRDAAKTKLLSAKVEPLGARRSKTPPPEPTLLAKLTEEGETRGVELSIAPKAPSGSFYGQLVVQTDNPQVKRLTARVRAKVQASVAARPQRVRFHIPEGGGQQTQKFVVHSTDGRPLDVLEVKAHHPSLEASFTPVNERRTKVTVTCNGETRLDREMTTLSVRTSSKDDPQIEVPVEIYRLRREVNQPTGTPVSLSDGSGP